MSRIAATATSSAMLNTQIGVAVARKAATVEATQAQAMLSLLDAAARIQSQPPGKNANHQVAPPRGPDRGLDVTA